MGELQSRFIRLDGLIEQLELAIRGAQVEVVKGQFGMKAETRIFEIGVTGLRFRTRIRDTAADSSPEIDFIIEIDGQREVPGAIVGKIGQEVGLVGRFAYGVCADAGANRGTSCERALRMAARAAAKLASAIFNV